MLKNILIYKDHLLPPSETFILNQTRTVNTYIPYFIGSRKINGLPLPEKRTIVTNRETLTGWVKEIAFKVLGFAPSFFMKLKQLDPLLIHAHFGVGGVFSLPIKKKLKVPLIVTFHGFDATVKEEYALKSFYGHRKYIKNKDELKSEATLFIAVSHFIRGKLLAQGFPPHKVVTHYVGIDVDYFIPDETIKREDVVLFVGRLVENKGCEYLIKAMSKVQEHHPNTQLVVIGDGPLRAELEEHAKNSLVNYIFKGTLSQEEVKVWLNKAKIFSVPSVTLETGASEGFGMVFAEANAMGVPVVSFKTGGISEAVKDQETGYLVEEKDWLSLAFKIVELLENQTLWEKFSWSGKQRVRQHFNLKEQTKLLEGIYGQVIRSGK